MYEDYFGLERPPFKITPDTSLFYDSGKRGDILADGCSVDLGERLDERPDRQQTATADQDVDLDFE